MFGKYGRTYINDIHLNINIYTCQLKIGNFIFNSCLMTFIDYICVFTCCFILLFRNQFEKVGLNVGHLAI